MLVEYCNASQRSWVRIQFLSDFFHAFFSQLLKDSTRLIPKHFCAVYNYAGKADLSKGYCNPKRLQIIKQQLF